MKLPCLAGALLLLTIMSTVAPVMAQDEVDVPWTDTPSTIDGVIETTEWAEAAQVIGLGDVAFAAYFLADDQYLYVAFDVTNDSSADDEDQVGIYFDNNRDGQWPGDCPGTTEGNYWLSVNGADLDLTYRTIWQNEGNVLECESAEATAVEAAFSDESGHLQYELRIDLTAGEMAGAPGDSIGVWLFAYDFGEDMGWWPDSEDPFEIGNFAALNYPENPADDDTADDDTTDDDTVDDDTSDDDTTDDDITDDDTNDDDADDDSSPISGQDDDDDDGCGC